MFTSFKNSKKLFPSLFNKARASFGKKFFVVENLEEIIVIQRNYPGALSHTLNIFQNNRVNITKIETTLMNRESKFQKVMFNITVEGKKDDQHIANTLRDLTERYEHVEINNDLEEVPWFPRTQKDLELLGKTLLDVKDEVNSDHEQFKDPEYRKRRDVIAKIAEQHKTGEPIPLIEYTDTENKTWNHIYNKVTPHHKKIFHRKYNENFDLLKKHCGLGGARIPQLKHLDEFLKVKTGWRIKPVHGILSQREFLNALAHKVFCCTQYIRHHSRPEYTPEPDIIHEVIGHIPLFADDEFSKLSQEIGLLTLGATDQQIALMGALYWYTIEFGSVKDEFTGDIKAYGAGIAGSFGECEHYQSGIAKFSYLDPFKNFSTEYPIQSVQPIYYYNNSFEEAIRMIIKFGKSLRKPMKCYYDETTKTVKSDTKVRAVETKETGPLF